jgi:hypothetical protein
MLLDVIPIAIFIYGYFLLAFRRFFGLGALAAAGITFLFGVASYFVEANVHGLNGSVGYLPALAALMTFAALLALGIAPPSESAPRGQTALGLAAAAAIFLVSLSFRTIDREICQTVPTGSYFLWHLLNACVLWLLLRTAILARPAATSAA